VSAAIEFAPVHRAILDHAEREHPRECCGFIYSVGDELRALAVRNASRDDREFYMAPWDQFNATMDIHDAGGRLRGIYHSHPLGTPTPSARDRAFAARWPGIVMLICAEGAVRAYTHAGEPF
jgi:proteasome lid subunit RPN8/RPN11